jgi:polyhydroxyalkanoate synthesis repressor PhaR
MFDLSSSVRQSDPDRALYPDAPPAHPGAISLRGGTRLLHRTIPIVGTPKAQVKDFLLHRTNRRPGDAPQIQTSDKSVGYNGRPVSTEPGMSETPLRAIKKYPNRRLYDTASSGYITLADVKQMVLDNIEFQVIDAKTGDDLSRTILLQIILEEEAGGMPMFSSEMLAQMIRFYGSAQQTIMGSYIEQNVKAFMAIQKKLQDQAKQIYGDKMMLTPDLWKQFMQMQAPAMQGMLGNYLEQSAKLFMDMQQRMQDQTRGMFAAFPFPNFAAAPQDAADEGKKK